MKMNDREWEIENERLQNVLEVARKQYDENRDTKEKIRRDAVDIQRELWDDVGSVSIVNGLDQIADFMGFISIMRMQKRSHELTRKLQEKYERILSSPYFGRIDFLEDGEEKAEKYYIGLSNLINDDYEFLIYDWRAPVSSMFYDYELGRASYQCPEGSIEGRLTLKRQYKINKGKIEFMFDSNLKIDDEILQDILSKSADSKMKAIVTTIQREQNKAIRNEEYQNLIVQGPAGSGKTSVALHRIAYLLYKYRDKITPQNIVVFSPNEIFNDYISNVLPQLGEDNMYQTTFKEYMHKALGDELMKEDYCEMMEYILTSNKGFNYQKRINNIKYKSSLEFIDVLKQFVAHVENMERDFKDIVFRDKLIISAEELRELFFKDYDNIQLTVKKKLQKIKERILYLIEPYKNQRIEEVTAELWNTGEYLDKVEVFQRSLAIVNEEMKDIYKDIDRMTKFDIVDIYKQLFENPQFFYISSNTQFSENDIAEIRSYSLENLRSRRLNYEDQPALLYLKGALEGTPKTSDIKYVIIDEAQDYTPLQYEIFYQLFNHANMTMLGDLNQSINPFMNLGDYSNIYSILPQSKTCLMKLTKSYRSTMEITNFSRKLLNKEITDECVERSGDKPVIHGFPDEDAINERILKDIKTYKEKGYKSIGIITRTIKEGKKVYDFLKDKVHVKAIMKDDAEYVSDTIVIPAYLAKGLEFDVAIIYNAGNGNYSSEEERLLLYTACTRALHILCVYYSGEITPLLKDSF